MLEGLLLLDGHEEFYEKIEDVLSTLVITLIALAYPTYKGLSIIRNWKELEKTLIDQGMQLNVGDEKKIADLDSINNILMDELHRRKKAEDIIKNERQKFFNMLDQLPICFHLQADDYTVPYSGKGIGLAICKRVVENHNAELKVESQMNVGTIFTISLPKSCNAS